MTEEEQVQVNKPGFWGSTLSKLKSALSRTKTAIVDSIVDDSAEDPAAELGAAAAEQSSAPIEEERAGRGELSKQPVVVEAFEEEAVKPVSPQDEPVQAQVAEVEDQSAPPEIPGGLAADFEPALSQAGNESNLDASIPPPPQVPAANQVAARPSSKPKLTSPPRTIDDDYLEELEEKLIKADLGLHTAETMVEHLRKESRSRGWTSRDVEQFLKKEFTSMLSSARHYKLKYSPGKLNIYLVVGVNGTGKTTSIGKLGWRMKTDGQKVLMAAADTFRAAAESQLEIWAERAGVEIVRLADGSDPGAVVYQALQKAKAEGYQCLVIDTAGRLHNKANLMAELKKIRTVIEKNAGNAELESLLVLDASTGQNGLQQAKVFTEVCPLTGVILTKLDGSAKGGVVFSITSELKIPVKLIGLGEKIDDLRDFEPELFVEALF